jgi:hypothetical protein
MRVAELIAEERKIAEDGSPDLRLGTSWRSSTGS